jgi:hypothetical protein
MYSRTGAKGNLVQIVECQIEITFENSMLEFRVLVAMVGDRDCGKVMQKDDSDSKLDRSANSKYPNVDLATEFLEDSPTTHDKFEHAQNTRS